MQHTKELRPFTEATSGKMALASMELLDSRATTTDRVVLACEDNLAFMERLPDGQMKLVVTSPPTIWARTTRPRLHSTTT